MKALTYHGPGHRTWGDVPDPVVVDAEDAVVRVDAVTICGTDLHILKGDVPEVTDGRILGHEAVGTVLAAGPGVRTVTAGDRVLVSCISACGRCSYCRAATYGQCTGGGGWILGHWTCSRPAAFPLSGRTPWTPPRPARTAEPRVPPLDIRHPERAGRPRVNSGCRRHAGSAGPHLLPGTRRRTLPRTSHERGKPPPGERVLVESE